MRKILRMILHGARGPATMRQTRPTTQALP